MPRYGPTEMTGARGPLLLLSLSRVEQSLHLRHDWTARPATMGRVEPVIILPPAPRNLREVLASVFRARRAAWQNI